MPVGPGYTEGLPSFGRHDGNETRFTETFTTPSDSDPTATPTYTNDETGEIGPVSNVTFLHTSSLEQINFIIAELEVREREDEEDPQHPLEALLTAQLMAAWRQQVRIMNNKTEQDRPKTV